MTVVYNIKAYQRTSVTIKFVWKDTDGSPKNLASFTGALHVRRYSTARGTHYLEDPVIEATTTNGKLLFDPELGEIRLALLPEDLDVPAGLYRYDLLLTEDVSPPQNNIRLVEGEFTINKIVTEP